MLRLPADGALELAPLSGGARHPAAPDRDGRCEGLSGCFAGERLRVEREAAAR
ncbi:DUF7586 domain-containing protein [Micromonospora musae]|uniref:DUF7586 domain-containing protein n=1 Tax=Micromonospora musae TaxID=1894970 RepID=UPI003F4CF184